MHGPTTSLQTYRVSRADGGRISQQVNQQNKTFKAVREFVDFFSEAPEKCRYIERVSAD